MTDTKTMRTIDKMEERRDDMEDAELILRITTGRPWIANEEQLERIGVRFTEH